MRQVCTEFRFTSPDLTFDDYSKITSFILRELLIDRLLTDWLITARPRTSWEDFYRTVSKIKELTVGGPDCSDFGEQLPERFIVDVLEVRATRV
jgi:hypothetical protein